jgi:hypothetical protein
VKDVKPPRLLGTAATAIVPDALKDPVKSAFQGLHGGLCQALFDPADMLNMLGRLQWTLPTQSCAMSQTPPMLRRSRPIWSRTWSSVLNQRFSPKTHVGVDASSVIIVELKDGAWVPAALVK